MLLQEEWYAPSHGKGIMEERDRATREQLCKTFSKETFAEWTNITKHGVIDRANEDMNHHI